jgi:hypothetical protein
MVKLNPNIQSPMPEFKTLSLPYDDFTDPSSTYT